jgi:hypothetical protein
MDKATNTAPEAWRAIPGYEGYEVSSLGRVRSVDRFTSDGRNIKGRILKTWIAAGRYQYVGLGRKVKVGVHRLVCAAFHGDPAPKMEAAHLDGNPLNNAASNVAWSTRSENEQHKRLHGTYARPRVFNQPHHKKRGTKPSRHPRADEMNAMRKSGATIQQVADAMGMSKSGAYGALKDRC